MKKITALTVMLFISASIYSQEQIPNGNFEDWSDNYNAVGWNSINFITVHSCQQSTDYYQGSYAAELESQSALGNYIPGLITLGEIDYDNYTITGGIEFSDRPDGLSYFFKYSPVNSDTAFMISFLTKWNYATEEPDTIGITAYFTADPYNDYIQVAVPYIYNSEENPDTLNIIFVSSGFGGNSGSSLIIDSVALIYGEVISPTICFPASDTTSSQFTGNWFNIPDATSYRIDVSEQADFSTYFSGYEDFDTGTDTFYTVNITPGIYYYRVRVHYDTEVSINSNTMPVPAPTECEDATNITTNSFSANWQAANNATGYFIDVSTDANFGTFISGYENYSAGNNTNVVISDLENNTEYFYRVRVEYDGFLSKNSNTVSINTEASGINYISFNDISIFSDENIIKIHFRNENIPENIFIYDINGKLIRQKTNPEKEEIFTLKNSGIFIVKIIQQNKISVKKISVVF